MATINDTELWSSVFGSGFETWSWWVSVEDGPFTDWETPGTVDLTIDDPEHGEGSGKTITKTVSIDELRAAVKALELDDEELEDIDAEVGDAILQQAIFGEVVYG